MSEVLIIEILKALGDKTRLDIVRKLAREERGASCSDVSTCSSLSQPAMSHHFSKLVEANVLTENKDGKEKIYQLNRELLQANGIDPDLL